MLKWELKGVYVPSVNYKVTFLRVVVTFAGQLKAAVYTPNANMADRSVVARNELHKSEASEA